MRGENLVVLWWEMNVEDEQPEKSATFLPAIDETTQRHHGIKPEKSHDLSKSTSLALTPLKQYLFHQWFSIN